MNGRRRPCPICTAPLDDTPIWVTHGYLKDGRRVPWDNYTPRKGWKRWVCPRCGTVYWVKPFAKRKAAERVTY